MRGATTLGRALAGALALAVVACAPERSTNAPTTIASSTVPVAVSSTVSPPADPRIHPESAAWDALTCAAANPLRWAYHRAPRRPTIATPRGLLFGDAGDDLVLVDAVSGELRWRDASTGDVRWIELVAGDRAALAMGHRGEAETARLLDLEGRGVDLPSSSQRRRAHAIGPALAIEDACTLTLMDGAGAPIFRAQGRAQVVLDDGDLCTDPPLLVAADEAGAVIAGRSRGRLQLLRVDPRSGGVVGAVDLAEDARLAREPKTGLLLESRSASVRAIRVDADGPRTRRWDRRGAEALEVRGVQRIDGPPLLLIREGRRWTAVDPLTLADRWTIISEAALAILGEVTSDDAEARALARIRQLRVVAAEDGATIARERIVDGREVYLVGDVALVEGSAGVVAVDLGGGAPRWALPGRVQGVHARGIVAVSSLRRGESLDVVDARAGMSLLRVPMEATLITRVADAAADLSVIAVEGAPAIVAYADTPAAARRLRDDPIEAFAPACAGYRVISVEAMRRYGACHLPSPHTLRFAEGSVDLPAGAAPLLDRLATDWRRVVLVDLREPSVWPELLVHAFRSPREGPELALQRAAAVRDALVDRGVHCSNIVIAADPDPVSTRLDVTWHAPINCLL